MCNPELVPTSSLVFIMTILNSSHKIWSLVFTISLKFSFNWSTVKLFDNLIWWICSHCSLGCAADGVWTNIRGSSIIESTITINRIRLFSEKLLDFFQRRKKNNLHSVDVLIYSNLFCGIQDTPIALHSITVMDHHLLRAVFPVDWCRGWVSCDYWECHN